MFQILTVDNFNIKGKIVGLRVDINSPIINNKVVLNERITEHSKTLKELLDKGAKVVLLAHQGRFGKDDCISLKEHCKLISKIIKKDITFQENFNPIDIQTNIRKLKNGEVLMLENLRFLKEEENPTRINNRVKFLEKFFDFYCFDAFSVSHRDQSSVTLINKIPVFAGRVMEKEIKGLNNIEDAKSPRIFLFGGSKPDDLIELMESALKNDKVDQILLTGVIGEVALHIKGYYLGEKLKVLENNGFLNSKSRLKNLLIKYPTKIFAPFDVAVYNKNSRVEIKVDYMKDYLTNNNILIQDIGSKTITMYSKLIEKAGSVYIKGPAGNFEERAEFGFGTKKLFEAATKNTNSPFTYAGGGHTITAAKMYGVLNKLSYISLAGGALVHFLSGQTLPGIKTLENSFKVHIKENQDFTVVGSNTLDISVSLPEELKDLKLGEKIKINENFKTTIGGGGLNFSVAITKLGGKVNYLGKLSTENLDLLKKTLNEFSIGLINSKPTKAACAKSIILDTVEKDRIIFTFRGQNQDLELSDFKYEDLVGNNFYFSSLSGTSFKTLVSLAKKIKKENKFAKIFYNPSSYLIKSEKKVKDLITISDYVIVNYDEAQELVGIGKSVSQCLKEIHKLKTNVVVITDGKNGSYAYDGKKEYYQKAILRKEGIYTTGAGDCFSATFFYFITNGFGIQRALKFATLNSSSLVTKKGAQNGLLTYEELLKLK